MTIALALQRWLDAGYGHCDSWFNPDRIYYPNYSDHLVIGSVYIFSMRPASVFGRILIRKFHEHWVTCLAEGSSPLERALDNHCLILSSSRPSGPSRGIQKELASLFAHFTPFHFLTLHPLHSGFRSSANEGV